MTTKNDSHQIIKALLALPKGQMINANQMIGLGIAKSKATIYYLRVCGVGPEFQECSKRNQKSQYLYLPESIIKWLETSEYGKKLLKTASRQRKQSSTAKLSKTGDRPKGNETLE